jgi:Tol biopolymer transport system component
MMPFKEGDRKGRGEEWSLQTLNGPWWSKAGPFATMDPAPKKKQSARRYMPLEIGEFLKDRYKIEAILGQGGMGAVYRAVDENLGVAVAVKENLFITEEYARQFHREASILAGLRHPNLPRVTDHFVIEGEGQYLVMDYVEGEDLRDKLERNEIIPEETALPWFMEICDALAYLHSRVPPIYHRDIKPGNIKITPDGRAVLVDFGLAKVADEDGSTTAGAKAMTPGFSPPEQYGTGPTDARTDVYSLAATLYAALCGAIPEDALERAMRRETLTPLRKWNSKVSSGVARALERALEVSPDERYQTINELAAALGAARSSGKTTVSRGLHYLNPDVRKVFDTQTGKMRVQVDAAPARRRRWLIPILALATLGAVVAGVYFYAPELGDRLVAFILPSATLAETEAISPSDTSLPSEGDTPGTALPTESEVLAGVTAEGQTAVATEGTPAVPTPAATAVGGGVGQIAFASVRDEAAQIFLINVDTTGLTQLTHQQDGACQPNFSSDGTQLLFTSPCRGNQEQYPGSSIWILSLDDLEARQLPTIPGGGDFDPVWAPDGEHIAFTSLRDGWPQVYEMKVDGTELRNVSSSFQSDAQPTYDPTGSYFLVSGIRSPIWEILLMPTEGEGEQLFSMGESQGHTHPDWSSDGQYVLYERVIGNVPRLVVKPFQERLRVATQICPEGPRASQPMAEGRWSPDGHYIVFETWPDGISHNIAIMTSSCTNYALLTEGRSLDFDPVWRPVSPPSSN